MAEAVVAPSPHSANIGTVIGMLLVAFVLCMPDMKYDLEMTRKGHGYAAVNNAFSSQVMGNKYSKRVPGRHYHTPASPMEHLGIRWLNSHSTGATKTML